MFSKAPVGVLIALLTILTAPLRAETHGPTFNSQTTQLQATANQAFNLQLSTLLSDQGSGALTWSVSQDMPTWLTLSNTNGTLSGTPAPADSGVHHFTISVSDGESGSANHDVYITVLAPPVWTKNPVDFGIVDEESAFTYDLKTNLSDPTGGSDTFQATGLPSWMTLNTATGVLSGTPVRANVGNDSGISITATGPGGTSVALIASGTVMEVIHPPHWITKDITLPNVNEETPYSQDVTQYALNPEGTQLTYTIVSATPPTWLTLGGTSGTLFGNPNSANVGANTVAIILSTTINGQTYTDTANFHFQVVHVNHAPYWLANPLVLPSVTATNAYTQNLSQSATDPDGDSLTYAIVSFGGPGPAWATIDPKTGILTGTPTNANTGTNTLSVSVTDGGGLSATNTVQVTVLRQNLPPTWNAHPIILPDGKEDAAYGADLTTKATDPNQMASDPISFAKLDGPAWITITPSGALMGTPGASDVGLVSFHAQVSNKEGADTTVIQFTVAHVNHPPIWTLSPVFSVNEDSPLSGVTVAPYATDPDKGDTLTFSLIQGPSWVTLASNGTLSGTPTMAVEGANTLTVRVTDQGGLYADTTVTIDVNHVNHPPFWTQNPITAPDAKEETAYTTSVASDAQDPDKGDKLTFSLVSGPAWISMSADGTLSGTPADSDVGSASLQVRVTDLAGASAVATVNLNVDKINHPPYWRQSPVQMADAYEDTTYTFNLAPYAVDPDGDALTFAKVSGPAWLFVNASGAVSGVPAKADVGTYQAVFSVTDGKSTPVTVNATGQVIHKNHPPVISPTMPAFTVKERAVLQTSLLQYVTDQDGDKLNFTLLDTASWVTLTPAGDLTLSPTHPDIGSHSFRFTVDDGQIAVNGTIQVQVIRDPRPPVWLQNPITMTAKTNVSFTGTVADEAKDLDGIPITFKKKDGNAWLVVGADGTLSGTPTNADLGTDTFTLTVCNDLLCADGTLIINVQPGMQIDTTAVDSPVPGARVENLWVVDNSQSCDQTISDLKSNIHYYFEDLASADINSAGIYLSSDAHKWQGLPIYQQGTPMLITGNQPDPASDFDDRVDQGSSFDSCGNCYNSPIWAMHLFYGRLSSLSEIASTYFQPTVPMDAMIVTEQRDHFPWYAKKDPKLAKYTAADWTDSFEALHSAKEKAFRVSAIAPECPALLEATGNPTTAAPDNAYQVMTQKTKGSYYALGCQFNMAETLHDYASKVIFRAYIHAKNRIKLSQTPIDPSTITVTVGGTQLPSAEWSYDAGTNEVVIDWSQVDQGQLKPGDQIQISYRVS